MRPTTSFTLHAALATVLIAFAATSAAAADAYLKLGEIKGEARGEGYKEQLEIHSWSWGATSPGSLAPRGEKGGTEDINIGVGELQEAQPPGSAASSNVISPRDAASGLPTGKRQHKPFTITKEVDKGTPAVVEKRQHGWVTVSKPLERGAVRVKVKFPWAGCAVGDRYPAITLGDGANSYQLQDVTVASCARAAGAGAEGPEESITFVYGKLGTKVQVRGWDPEKK